MVMHDVSYNNGDNDYDNCKSNNNNNKNKNKMSSKNNIAGMMITIV